MNILIISFISSHILKEGAGNVSHIRNMTKYLQHLGHKIYFLYIDSNIENYDLKGMENEWDYVDIIKSYKIFEGLSGKGKFDFGYTDEIGNKAIDICNKFSIHMCICHYFVFSKVLEIIPNNIIKVIDTHDIFTNRHNLLGKNLIPKEFFNLSKNEERNYLNRADIIISRTDADRLFFNKLTNSNKALTLTYFSLKEGGGVNKEYKDLRTIGFVGSFNIINIVCILQFLNKFDKEFKKGNLKDVKIEIVGNVFTNIHKIYKLFSTISRIKLFLKNFTFKAFFNIFRPNLARKFVKTIINREYLINTGFVDNLDDFYNRVDLIIVPVIFGTGVNIKTAEALSKGLPICSTVNGIKGFNSNIKEHNANSIKELVSYIKDIHKHPQRLNELAISSKNIYLNYLKSFKVNINKLLMRELTFPHANNPLVSIIIPVYNNIKLTYECCKAILENTPDISYEIIIVDDASNNIGEDHLESYIKNVKIIKNKENLGYLRSCNLASNVAKGKYILLLNNDTLVQKDWLKYILKTFELKKDVGIVGGMLLNIDGSIQEAGAFLSSNMLSGLINSYNSPLYSCEYLRTTSYVSGACLCIPRELFFKAGKFDEIYRDGYSEDADLCMKIRELGYEVYYQPKAKIIHIGSQTYGLDPTKKLNLLEKNNKILFEKWEKQIHNNFYPFSDSGNPSEYFLMRNNIKQKKTILCFDENVPTIYHGGGRSSLSYLKIFLKMGLNVKFYPKDIAPQEYMYIDGLQQLGIEVIFPRNEITPFLKHNGKYIDYVFLQRPYTRQYLPILKQYTQAKILYYGHDLHFLRMQETYNHTKDQKDLNMSKEFKNLELELLNKVDIAYYPSIYEVNYLNKLLPKKNIYLLNPLFYNSPKLANSSNNFSKRENNILFVASTHYPNIDGLKWFIDNVWNEVLINNNKSIYLKIIGNIITAFDEETITKLKKVNVSFLNNVSDSELEHLYKNAKLTISPYRLGGGVITKVIEAIYYKVPVVSTTVGIKGISEYDFTNLIYVADDAKSFVNQINKILLPNYLYNEHQAKQFIDNYFTQDIMIKQLKKGL